MANPKSGIYRIVNSANGKFYIGSAVNLDRRWYMHKNRLNHRKHGNIHLQRAWDKYGRATFTLEMLECVTDKTRLLEREQAWLDALYDELTTYNICKVANSRIGVKARPETIEKMRAAATGVRHSKEARRKMSKAKTGLKLPPRTDAHRRMISERHKGKAVSEDTRAKLRAARARRPPPSEETRRKMSEAMRKTLAEKKTRAAGVVDAHVKEKLDIQGDEDAS